jgi:hypothetical protein
LARSRANTNSVFVATMEDGTDKARPLSSQDYAYERNGTANLLLMFAPREGCANAKVTDRHSAVDDARVLKDRAGLDFAGADLNVHSKVSLYEAFAAAETRRLSSTSDGTTPQA